MRNVYAVMDEPLCEFTFTQRIAITIIPRMIRWKLSSNVGDILELGPRAAGRLGTVGIRTVGDLLQANLSQIADQNYNLQLLNHWKREAQLLIELPELPPAAARALAVMGIWSAAQLREKSPSELMSKWEETARDESTPKWFATEKIPAIRVLCTWIATAQHEAPKSAA